MDSDSIARENLIQTKSGAVWIIGLELGDYLNKRAISETYFGKSREWLSQRIIGNRINGKKAEFKPEEYEIFSSALRDIADKFSKAADMLDAAE